MYKYFVSKLSYYKYKLFYKSFNNKKIHIKNKKVVLFWSSKRLQTILPTFKNILFDQLLSYFLIHICVLTFKIIALDDK